MIDTLRFILYLVFCLPKLKHVFKDNDKKKCIKPRLQRMDNIGTTTIAVYKTDRTEYSV